MLISAQKLIEGYRSFKSRFTSGDQTVMQQLAFNGQKPEYMVISCCDSRVDPSLIFQTGPGEIFTARNVANIVPPYEADEKHHGTSAALEFAVCYLEIKHLIIMGHSQCGGIQARLNGEELHHQNDFISSWVSVINFNDTNINSDDAAKIGLTQSYENCLTFPWIKTRIANNQLVVHLWFFDIETAEIEQYDFANKTFVPLL